MTTDQEQPSGAFKERRLAGALDEAMADTRVVLVNGARQSGKSTLVRMAAHGRGALWRTLDNEATRLAAEDDPVGFVDVSTPMVIDEIQRVPRLLLAIKERVDLDPRPGRYLLTGSARVLGLREVVDALPGRMETLELFPFSQGEISGQPDSFVDTAFSLGADLAHESAVTRAEYAQAVVRGGFPEAVSRPSARRRERFLDSYVEQLVDRDIIEVGEVERVSQMKALIALMAARSGQLLKLEALGNEVGLSRHTVARYVSLLETVFLIKRIPAWSRNLSRRATATPKLAMVDSGIAANLLGQDATRLVRPAAPFGPLLEGFALMELARQLTWSQERVTLFHYRDRDQREVDAILESRRGEVVGVEVKASSTVRPHDFRGLRYLRDVLGGDFLLGVVLYTGSQTLSFGEKLKAMPLSSLWELAAPSAPSMPASR